MKSKDLIINPNDIITFDVIEWLHEGWEFGKPIVMISPIVRIAYDGCIENLIEHVCTDIVCGDDVQSYIDDSELRDIEWRGWNLKSLRNRFCEVLKGKKFPRAGYSIKRQKVKFLAEKELLKFDPEYKFSGYQFLD